MADNFLMGVTVLPGFAQSRSDSSTTAAMLEVTTRPQPAQEESLQLPTFGELDLSALHSIGHFRVLLIACKQSQDKHTDTTVSPSIPTWHPMASLPWLNIVCYEQCFKGRQSLTF